MLGKRKKGETQDAKPDETEENPADSVIPEADGGSDQA